MSKTEHTDDLTLEEIRDIEECRKYDDGQRKTFQEFLKELDE